MNKSYLFKTKKTDITQEVALRKTKRRWAVLLLCLLLLTPTFAQTKDTTAIAEHQNKWNEVLKESRNNPAFMQDAFNTSTLNTEMLTDISNWKQAADIA